MPSFPFFMGSPSFHANGKPRLANHVTKSSRNGGGNACYSYGCDGADPSPITKVPPIGNLEAPPSAPPSGGASSFRPAVAEALRASSAAAMPSVLGVGKLHLSIAI